MKTEDFCDRLYELKFTSGMNARYHHHLEARWGGWDKVVRITVGALSVAGLVTTLMGRDLDAWSTWLAIASVFAAVALNVIPLADWEKKHGDLFRRWVDLRRDCQILEDRTCALPAGEDAKPGILERLQELREREHAIDAAEPAPDRKLLLQCQEDETESIFGVRTNAEVEELKKRQAACAAAALPAGGAGSAAAPPGPAS